MCVQTSHFANVTMGWSSYSHFSPDKCPSSKVGEAMESEWRRSVWKLSRREAREKQRDCGTNSGSPAKAWRGMKPKGDDGACHLRLLEAIVKVTFCITRKRLKKKRSFEAVYLKHYVPNRGGDLRSCQSMFWQTNLVRVFESIRILFSTTSHPSRLLVVAPNTSTSMACHTDRPPSEITPELPHTSIIFMTTLPFLLPYIFLYVVLINNQVPFSTIYETYW